MGKGRRSIGIVLAAVMLTVLTGAGLVSGGEAAGTALGKDKLNTRSGQPSSQMPGGEETGRGVKQLTAEDIDEMNNGDCAMLFSDEGYLVFLRGRYYDKPVTNFEEGIESLFGIQGLLGITKGSEFFAVFVQRDEMGYTCYTYQQRYGDLTLQNAVLKIFTDPEGYPCGLVSSFTPNVGIAPEDESSITAGEALEVVKKNSPWRDELRFYPDDTRQTSITDVNGITMHCWAVFSNLPAELADMEGPSYLEHLVTYDGRYVYYTPVNSPREMVLGENVQTEVALTWFSGLQGDTYTGTVTTHDGTRKEISVPVAYDPESGTYYLADIKRHILLSDYYSWMVDNRYAPFTSKDNTGWPDLYLITYDTYIKVYDFYEMLGLQSVDGFGIPIVILTDWCSEDAYRVPVKNAAFLGISDGWAQFGASSVGNYGECVDVIGHEFTHGVCNYSMAGWNYTNENGALNEALSDIMGNLIEWVLEETEDTSWQISENSGETLRSMSIPWLHQQPVTVDGRFYVPNQAVPSNSNDFGGVHTNSSLLNYVAWKLHAAGMDPMEELYLYREAINFVTPLSGFREFHQALLFAGEIRNLDIEWLVMINMCCEEAGY